VGSYVAVFCSATLAFAIRGFERTRNAVRALCFFLSIAPYQFSILPLLHAVSALGIAGSAVGVGLCMGASMIPLGVLLLDAQLERRCAGHFLLLRLSGVSPITGFIVLWPIIRSGAASILLLGALRFSGTLYLPLLLTLGRPDLQPLSVRLYQLISLHPGDQPLQLAAATIASLPALLAVLLLNRAFSKTAEA
jgi:ABC-type glycerol-3-phosphate transport system permease component